MSEQKQGDEKAAIQALATVLSESMKRMAVTAEAQQVTILGTAAIVACLADTASIPTERLAAVLGLLTQGRPEAFRKKIAEFIGLTVTVSQKLPAALAANKLAQEKAAAEAAKATKN